MDDLSEELQLQIPPGWWDWDARPHRNEPVMPAPAALAATAAPGTCRFLDVSHWQGAIDFTAVRGAGYVAVIAKCTEGTGYVDPYARRNLERSAAAGLIPGGYLFLRRGQDVPSQVRAYMNVLGDPDGKLVALDAETSGSGTDPTRAEVFDAAAELRRATGRWPIAYIPRWWWSKIGGGQGPTSCPLWQSAYSSGPGPLFGGWDRFAAWQYTSSAAVPGVNGRCDANVFYGTRAELAALAGATQPVGEWDEMATQEELKQAVRSVLNEGTGAGQNNWGDTSAATLATAQTLVNRVNQVLGGLGQLRNAVAALGSGAIDVQALAAELRAVLGPELAAALAVELGSRLVTKPPPSMTTPTV